MWDGKFWDVTEHLSSWAIVLLQFPPAELPLTKIANPCKQACRACHVAIYGGDGSPKKAGLGLVRATCNFCWKLFLEEGQKK